MPEERAVKGLHGALSDTFPIESFDATLCLEFVSYSLEAPPATEAECRERGLTFAAPLRVSLRLLVWTRDEETGATSLQDAREQDVYLGEIPLMTPAGTFVINGTERVVVSQLHRAPGPLFELDEARTTATGAPAFRARILPYRGATLDFQADAAGYLTFSIDHRRKHPATLLLRALGAIQDPAEAAPLEFFGSAQEIIRYFYEIEPLSVTPDGVLLRRFSGQRFAGARCLREVRHPGTGDVLLAAGRRFTRSVIESLTAAGVTHVPIADPDLDRCFSAEEIVDQRSGEVLLDANDPLSADVVQKVLAATGRTMIEVFFSDERSAPATLRDTLATDGLTSADEALIELYRVLRPADPPTLESATSLLSDTLFRPERYDLSEVGRMRLNHRFAAAEPLSLRTLTKRDILEAVRELIALHNRKRNRAVDDVDHLGNRRVRSVGELLENQVRIGLARMRRATQERISLAEPEALQPRDLINPKPLTAVLHELFATSALAQPAEQTNPLAEVSHRRRLSTLGPGGLNREHAGLAVRDVHPTHYGRICPIETPEGANIGLIASLASFAWVNEYGFIESPYLRVVNGKVTPEVVYLTALDEGDQIIAQATTEMAAGGSFAAARVYARRGSEYGLVKPEDVTLIDVSPSQLCGVAASLIPFLENDDANRALMGANMQRQAVPLMHPERPLVGTGLEEHAARESTSVVVAKRDGVVYAVRPSKIVVRADDTSFDFVDTYPLTRFARSNQRTCLHQRPRVTEGQRVAAGEVLADGAATADGDLALGRNLVVAFMPWHGYNFEDSVLVSASLVHEDAFTSVHIEEFECVARDTRLGAEEVTRKLPHVAADALANLDEFGIVRIGAEVRAGDILVGKATPYGESEISPEEKLLRALFEAPVGNFRDTSLRAPAGLAGVVIDVSVYSRPGLADDAAARSGARADACLLREKLDEVKTLQSIAFAQARGILRAQRTTGRLVDSRGRTLVLGDVVLTDSVLDRIPPMLWASIPVRSDLAHTVERVFERLEDQRQLIEFIFDDRRHRLGKMPLDPGVQRTVKVKIAVKRRLSVGDKMAGRHGNKGVVSRIVPPADMPYLEDGTPVDIVLSPLGIPSRMNIGQLLETHLGWGARNIGARLAAMADANCAPEALRAALRRAYVDLARPDGPRLSAFIDGLTDEEVLAVARRLRVGVPVASPPFDGAQERDLEDLCSLGACTTQSILFDGCTGEAFENDVTVGVMYMMKLDHLVEDKVHARSTGPYALVTGQPLGGRAQHGGQRLGEMEVWALEAHGAAYSLREFMTVKSDDQSGRLQMEAALVTGKPIPQSAGIPGAFEVLTKELQGLALNFELLPHDAQQSGSVEAKGGPDPERDQGPDGARRVGDHA